MPVARRRSQHAKVGEVEAVNDHATDQGWRLAGGVGALPDSAGHHGLRLLADIADYGDINTWWRGQFPDPAQAPARLTFQAGALPFGAKIEFQAVAAVGGS